MSWYLVFGSLLVTGIEAFVPAPIQWGGWTTRSFALAPKASLHTSLPQKLTLQDLADSPSPNVIPHFSLELDRTIAWKDKGLCLEAVGTKNGDAVQVNRCNGGASQRWNWLPFVNTPTNQIELQGTGKCVDAVEREGSLSGVSVELQECSTDFAQAWSFEEPIPMPTASLAQRFAPPSPARHVPSSLVVLASLGALGLSAWLLRFSIKSRSMALDQGNVPLNAEEGGVCLTPAVMTVSAESMGKIRTVGEVKDAFYANYGISYLPFVVQGFVSEMLALMTFAMGPDFRYSRVFAFGFESLCNVFMETIETDEQKQKIKKAMLLAVDLDPETVKTDATEFAQMAEGLSESGLFDSEDFVKITEAENYKYSYPFGAGLLATMDLLKLKTDESTIERWCDRLQLRAAPLQKDAAYYQSIIKKVRETKDMILQSQISAKKKKADELAAKAQRLSEQAEAAAKAADKAVAEKQQTGLPEPAGEAATPPPPPGA